MCVDGFVRVSGERLGDVVGNSFSEEWAEDGRAQV